MKIIKSNTKVMISKKGLLNKKKSKEKPSKSLTSKATPPLTKIPMIAGATIYFLLGPSSMNKAIAPKT